MFTATVLLALKLLERQFSLVIIYWPVCMIFISIFLKLLCNSVLSNEIAARTFTITLQSTRFIIVRHYDD